MELWKKLGIIGCVYGLIFPLITWIFLRLFPDVFLEIPPKSISTLILYMIYPPYYTLLKTPIDLPYISLFINSLIWAFTFSVIGTLIGKFVEKHRTKNQIEKSSK